MQSKRNITLLAVLCLGIIPLVIAGCGSGGSGGSTGRATVLLSSSDSGGARTADSFITIALRGSTGSPVPVEDILRLELLVTEIVLQRCGGGEEDDNTVLVRNFEFDPTTITIEQGDTVTWLWEEDGEHTVTSGAAGDGDAGSLFDGAGSLTNDIFQATFVDIGVFPYFSNNGTDILEGMAGVVEVVADDDSRSAERGVVVDDPDGGHVDLDIEPFDVDIVTLETLSQVLTAADIPAGDYCKIRIRIENPRLWLTGDPLDGPPRTNVKLTANGRLFIKKHFEIEGGSEILIVINFGGIHLVDAGMSGMFVLTPQLRADVEITEAEVEIEGEILSIDCEGGIIVIRTEGGDEFDVLFDAETQFKDESDQPIDCVDLEPGQTIEAEGTLTIGGMLDATEIELDDTE